MRPVAIQGIRGSYSDDAVREIFGDTAAILECADFANTFAAVEDGIAESAVVPVRNKIVGEIENSVELLNASRLKVLDELSLRVKHVLVGTSDSKFDELQSVRSHVEALRQCRAFLSRNAHLTQIIGGDTASSVLRIIKENDPTAGAIGSRRAAAMYEAKILREDVADDTDNWTTFYLVGK